MSSSYKLKSHPTQSLYDHITGVRDIALKTHKYHTIKPEIDDFIEIVCMCHDFGKGTTYFQRYLENDFRGIEKDHGPISAMFTYWMLPDKWKHLGFLIVKKHHGDINNASDECRIDEVSWDFKNQIKDILDNTIDELNQIYDKYLEGKNIEAFLNWLDDESNLKSIKKEFRKKRVICKNIYAYEKQDGQIEIIMNARTVKGRLVTATELSKIMSNIMQKRLKPSDASRKVIDTGFGEYIFVEETKYKVLTGVARLTKDGQSVSGDTFSMINLPSGELLMALSDGMGSGTSAFDDSKNVIELLEQMSEAGFSQTSAIRLINSLYVSDQEFENYATLDISLINLYKGECSFLKNGAVGTYVLNQGKMYCIEGQSLPMGVVSDAEPYIGKMSLYPGDYVIMMTDGVADMFSQERYNLEKFIKQIEIVNPGDMAQAIVDEAVSRNKGTVSDDMSVIVAGVWEN